MVEMIQELNYPCDTSLVSLWYVHAPHVLRNPELDTGPLRLTQDS